MTRESSLAVGREVTLARANLGMSVTAAARIAGLAPLTQRRVEAGDPSVGLATLCRAAAVVGLKVWVRAFPIGPTSLRDSGQLRIAEFLRSMTASRMQVELEHAVGDQRSIDVAAFGPSELLAIEIERLLTDFQAQYRQADAKRVALAERHRRPVRLVLVVEDTRHNRRAVEDHTTLIRSALPAGTREILGVLRTGRELGRDGLAWVRPRRAHPHAGG